MVLHSSFLVKTSQSMTGSEMNVPEGNESVGTFEGSQGRRRWMDSLKADNRRKAGGDMYDRPALRRMT